MSLYKLHYFNIKGRAEVIRLILAYTGQKYEDYRVKLEDWAKIKPTTPIGKMPILEIHDDNKVTCLAQSRAIGRYLANKFNIAGDSLLEKAKADEIVDQTNDVIDMFAKNNIELDKEKKKKEYERLNSYVMPLNMAYFEKTLKENNTGYLVGKKLTWADLALMNFSDLFSNKKQQVLEKYPLVNKHDEMIRNLPSISQWLNKRPVSKI